MRLDLKIETGTPPEMEFKVRGKVPYGTPGDVPLLPKKQRDSSGHGSPPVPLFSAQFHTSSSRSFSVRKRLSCSSSSTSMEHHESKFKEFPYVSVPHRELMVELVSTMENLYFLAHVQYFENESATAHAFLYVRSGNSSSQLSAAVQQLSSSFLIYLRERTLSSQYPDYLKTFYEEMQLDKQRQLLEKLPEVKPYFSSSLYIRALFSPSAILVSVVYEEEELSLIV
ncbi:red chlorophyll catabolite reductase, chloroplastic-like [Solanum stenotomum]|uniref:red chlorophyll catabolite reductase, chloroplastic-like n=1 Tax=Solanum stenotomum TaxID=172797 RepID=UPI0020D0F354|nr:red chlorophyll catabolite reductase, chloroplastic-like [Solanum stenotomum]